MRSYKSTFPPKIVAYTLQQLLYWAETPQKSADELSIIDSFYLEILDQIKELEGNGLLIPTD